MNIYSSIDIKFKSIKLFGTVKKAQLEETKTMIIESSD